MVHNHKFPDGRHLGMKEEKVSRHGKNVFPAKLKNIIGIGLHLLLVFQEVKKIQ